MPRRGLRIVDAVDHFAAQWAAVRPEVDVTPMATLGRLSRYAAIVDQRLAEVFAEFDLQAWEFDVMAALRRAGEPFELTPGDLDRTTMISSGTTTHRLVKLEQRGFVTRTRDEADRRIVRVRLTDAGRELFDRAHVAHLDNERRLLEGLSDDERAWLLDGLRALGRNLGDVPPVVRPRSSIPPASTSA